jgi:GT2 family glycosyltransferase
MPHETFVVDDGSEPEVQDELGKLCQQNGAIFVPKEKNEGFAKTCNQGIIRSNGETVILLNNDVIPIRDSLDCLAESCMAMGAGILGCKLLYGDGRIQHAGVYYTPSPDPTKHGWFDHINRFNERWDFNACRIANRLVTGAAMCINSALINGVGLLDERFGMAAEDIDMGLRCLEIGMPVYYNGYIEMFHLEGQTRGNTAEEKSKHPEWLEAEEKGLDAFFSKWEGIDFNAMFGMK